MVHSPDFSKKVLQHFLVKRVFFRMALVEKVGQLQMIARLWYVQLAAIMHLYNVF